MVPLFPLFLFWRGGLGFRVYGLGLAWWPSGALFPVVWLWLPLLKQPTPEDENGYWATKNRDSVAGRGAPQPSAHLLCQQFEGSPRSLSLRPRGMAAGCTGGQHRRLALCPCFPSSPASHHPPRFCHPRGASAETYTSFRTSIKKRF